LWLAAAGASKSIAIIAENNNPFFVEIRSSFFVQT